MSNWRRQPSPNAKDWYANMRFDLADLSLFRHVVEAGSITHGAERAHLALAAASTRIRHMEQALGAALLVRGAAGVTPTQAGRTLLQHARTILAQAERLREDLGAYAGGLAGQVRVLSNTNALTEFLPETLSAFLDRASACQRRPRGAAVRRDRRTDRRGRRRHRHRCRHGRCRAARRPIRSAATASCSWWRAIIRSRAAHKVSFAEVLDHDFVGLDRASALQRFLADKASARRPAAPAAHPAAQLRGCAGWSSAMSASASCRRRPCAGPRRPWRSGGRTHRSVGAARSVDLRARLQGAAALCAPAGGSHARGEAGDLRSLYRGISTQ